MSEAPIFTLVPTAGSWILGSSTSSVVEPAPQMLIDSLPSPQSRTPAWVIPGLVDAHRHLPHAHEPMTADAIKVERSSAVAALAAVGVLRVDDMGVAPLTPWPLLPDGIRSAICGIEGPSEWPRPTFARMVRSPLEGAACVDEIVAAGATHIKIFATASGRLPEHQAVSATIDEAVLRALLQAARTSGVPAAVHCHGGSTLTACLDGGAASIEHGLYLTRRDLAALAATGCTLVLTPLVYLRRHGEKIHARMRALFEDALAAGVTVRLGTDSDRWTIADEITAMVELGLDADVVLSTALPVVDTAATPGEILAEHGAILLARDPRSDVTSVAEPLAVAPRCQPRS